MASCADCGAGLGFFSTRRLCAACGQRVEDEARREINQAKSLILSIIDGDSYDFQAVLALEALARKEREAGRAELESSIQSFATGMLGKEAKTYLERPRTAGDKPDWAQASRMSTLTFELGDVANKAAKEMGNAASAVAWLDRGVLPRRDDVPIRLELGEIGHYVSESDVILVAPVVTPAMTAGHASITVRATDRIAVNLGGLGATNASTVETKAVDGGPLVVTSRRLVFLGGGSTIETPLDRLVSLEAEDEIRLVARLSGEPAPRRFVITQLGQPQYVACLVRTILAGTATTEEPKVAPVGPDLQRTFALAFGANHSHLTLYEVLGIRGVDGIGSDPLPSCPVVRPDQEAELETLMDRAIEAGREWGPEIRSSLLGAELGLNDLVAQGLIREMAERGRFAEIDPAYPDMSQATEIAKSYRSLEGLSLPQVLAVRGAYTVLGSQLPASRRPEVRSEQEPELNAMITEAVGLRRGALRDQIDPLEAKWSDAIASGLLDEMDEREIAYYDPWADGRSPDEPQQDEDGFRTLTNDAS